MSVTTNIKNFYIYNTEGQLVEIIDSVDKAFEFLDNEGSYKVEENKRKVEENYEIFNISKLFR